MQIENRYIFLSFFILLALILFFVYRAGRRKSVTVNLPSGGTGIPPGWNPRIITERLLNAMEGWGTDEEAIFNALSGLSQDQLAAVYNDFNTLLPKGKTLFEWFRSELSGDDLIRALNFFAFIR
jgi:hypothetical protein